MSSATVRAAIQTYLDGASITGVTKVYKAPPYWIGADAFTTWVQDGWGAVIAINIDESKESRITLPAPSVSHPAAPIGQKRVKHDVALLVILEWIIPPSPSPLEDADAWTDALDQLLDDICTTLRADPNLGAPDVIFQAAQDPNDLSITRDLPKLDDGGGIIHVWQRIDFTAVEIVTA